MSKASNQQNLIQFNPTRDDAADPPFVVAEVRRLRDEVGWSPAHDIDQSLVATIDWWKDRGGRVEDTWPA